MSKQVEKIPISAKKKEFDDAAASGNPTTAKWGSNASVYSQAGAAKPVLSQFSSLVSAASKQPASVHSMAATRIIVGTFMICFLILHHTVRPRSHFHFLGV
jgi:hypothetical protein